VSSFVLVLVFVLGNLANFASQLNMSK